jgi:hypothetical protein
MKHITKKIAAITLLTCMQLIPNVPAQDVPAPEKENNETQTPAKEKENIVTICMAKGGPIIACAVLVYMIKKLSDLEGKIDTNAEEIRNLKNRSISLLNPNNSAVDSDVEDGTEKGSKKGSLKPGSSVAGSISGASIKRSTSQQP